MGNRHREAGLAALDALVAELKAAQRQSYEDNHATRVRGRIVAAEAERDEARKLLHGLTNDDVGGFDERFCGYGAEDKGFLVCASTLGGDKQRMSGYAYHLDHPEDPLRTSEATRQGNMLAERYEDYDGNEPAIRAMLAER